MNRSAYLSLDTFTINKGKIYRLGSHWRLLRSSRRNNNEPLVSDMQYISLHSHAGHLPRGHCSFLGTLALAEIANVRL